jgi:hypothetical protein
MSQQSGREHAGIVGDEQIPRLQQARKVPDDGVLDRARVPMEDEEPGVSPGHRVLSYQLIRQREIEITD